MDKGWIIIHRKIRDCDLVWDDKPFSRGQAWIDLLLMANHEDKEIMFNGTYIKIERGQRLTSIRKLSEAWGWSRTKTTKFLNELEKAEMLTVKSDTKKTLVTIVNYALYQDCITTEKPPKSHRKATEKPQKDTNNKLITMNNNDNNIVFSEYKDVQEAFEDFSIMRKEIKKPLTSVAIKKLQKRLCEMSTNPVEQAAILDQSTLNQWQGIFPLKNPIQPPKDEGGIKWQ